MSEKPTRRAVIAASATVVAASIASPVEASRKIVGLSKMSQSKPNAALSMEVEALQKTLQKPLVGEAEIALPSAVEGIHGDSHNRLRHMLTENSEPSFVFEAKAAKVRNWA